MFLRDHSIADLERRYLECYGEAKINNVWRIIFVAESMPDDSALRIVIYPERVSSIVDIQQCDWEFRFNIPQAQWYYDRNFNIRYVRRRMNQQFRRGVNGNTLEFMTLREDRRDRVALLGFGRELALSAIQETPTRIDTLRARIRQANSYILSRDFVAHHEHLFYQCSVVGYIADNVITVREAFTEELRDINRKLGADFTVIADKITASDPFIPIPPHQVVPPADWVVVPPLELNVLRNRQIVENPAAAIVREFEAIQREMANRVQEPEI